MKKSIYPLLFAIILSFFSTSVFAKTNKSEPLRVLFIGNSFTYFCNTPEIFGLFCKSRKIPVEIESSTPGGYGLAQHAKNERTQQLLSQKWDWVILQAQSVEPVYRKSEVLHWGKHLIKQAMDNGAQVLLFNTWGYRQPTTKEFDVDMHNKICQTYCELALATKCKLAPCGPAWKIVNEKYPQLDLYNKGDSNCHPSLQGAYLNACIFFTIITGKSPRNLPELRDRKNPQLAVTAKKALILQKVAAQTVKTFSPEKFLQEIKAQNQALPSFETIKNELKMNMTQEEAEKILGQSFQSNPESRLFLYKARNDIIIWVTYNSDNKIISAHANDWALK